MSAFVLWLVSLSLPTSSSSSSTSTPIFYWWGNLLILRSVFPYVCPPSSPPQRDYSPLHERSVHSNLLFYVPSKFSPASPLSTLYSLTLSPSLSLCHPSFPLSLSLYLSPFLPQPSLHPLDTSHSPPPLSPVNLPTLLPALSLALYVVV